MCACVFGLADYSRARRLLRTPQDALKRHSSHASAVNGLLAPSLYTGVANQHRRSWGLGNLHGRTSYGLPSSLLDHGGLLMRRVTGRGGGGAAAAGRGESFDKAAFSPSWGAGNAAGGAGGGINMRQRGGPA